jgi:hypothetical protein
MGVLMTQQMVIDEVRKLKSPGKQALTGRPAHTPLRKSRKQAIQKPGDTGLFLGRSSYHCKKTGLTGQVASLYKPYRIGGLYTQKNYGRKGPGFKVPGIEFSHCDSSA